MSVKASLWAWKEPTPVSAIARLVLLHLADSAGEGDAVRTHLDRAASWTHRPVEECREGLAELIDCELVDIREGYPDGSFVAHLVGKDRQKPVTA